MPGSRDTSAKEVDDNEIFEFTDADYETALPAGIAALKAGRVISIAAKYALVLQLTRFRNV